MTLATDIERQLDTVVKDTEARKDYASVRFEIPPAMLSLTASEVVHEFNGLKQALLIEQAKGTSVSPNQVDSVLNITTAMIAQNTTVQKMGQLNTNRTIEPTTAAADNNNLRALQSNLMMLKAETKSSSEPKLKEWPSASQLVFGARET